MTVKTKITATKDEAKPALLPKLRFPEFQASEGWTTETLEDALAISATYGIVTAGEFQREGIPMLRGGDIKEGRIGDGLPLVTAEIHSQYRRTILQADDVVISLVGYPGEAAVVPKHYVGANISRAVGLLRVKRLLSAPFLVCYLNSPQGRRTVLKPSAGSAQVVVNLKQLNALLIPTPSSAEQQKIAECLSSLDELMAAQARKVDALKTHKKGLMQQLFPREGETQPRLRFPEFQNAGEWEVKPLGKVAENLDNKRRPITSSDREAGDVPYYGASGIVDYVEGYIFDEDLLCVSEDGANLVARTYPIAFPISGKTWVNNHAHVLRFENACTQKFVEVYLNSIKLDDFITGMAQPKLNKAMLDRIPIPHTSVPEQQRIASCLSSLDALITAETQKLEALKTHKKGLMQQLFPAPTEQAHTSEGQRSGLFPSPEEVVA